MLEPRIIQLEARPQFEQLYDSTTIGGGIILVRRVYSIHDSPHKTSRGGGGGLIATRC
jgi:hypothetical protein